VKVDVQLGMYYEPWKKLDGYSTYLSAEVGFNLLIQKKNIFISDKPQEKLVQKPCQLAYAIQPKQSSCTSSSIIKTQMVYEQQESIFTDC
jgi:hypothetical protein